MPFACFPHRFVQRAVVLFIADIHFGRDPRAAERAKEQALIDCLDAHAGDVEHLYLVGDVFDEYIEYRHLVPKGFVRFQAYLASWTDAGIPVTYLRGNHDPWHHSYFEAELGVRMETTVRAKHYGRRLHITHGDGAAASGRVRRWMRRSLRHPVPVGLYRSVLPGDAGMALARWVNRTFHHPEPRDAVNDALRNHARDVLRTTPADTVVLAHTHVSALHTWPEGTYLNTGAWHQQRRLATLDAAGLRLHRWNGSQTLSIERASS